MSAILERTGIVLPEEQQVIRERRSGRSGVRTGRRARVKQQPIVTVAAVYCVKVTASAFLLVCISSGVCQYMFEQARHAGIAANTRAIAAENSLAGLRRDVDRLQSAQRIETWAALNGFTASYLASNEKAK